MPTKTLYIVRGLDGSGKTTLARSLCPWWHPLKRSIAADDYPNRYLAGGSLNPDIPHAQAHAWVRSQTERWMKQGLWAIAVHNVFSLEKYFEGFIFMAVQHGYSVQVIHAEGVVLPDRSIAKSVHGVPSELHEKWRSEWQKFNS